jgi:hypothetical protein
MGLEAPRREGSRRIDTSAEEHFNGMKYSSI